MESIVLRKSITVPHCCYFLLSPHSFLLMGFSLFQFPDIFVSFFPCSLFHPCSFVLGSFNFSFLFCLTPCLSLCHSFCPCLSVSSLNLCFSLPLPDRWQVSGSWWGVWVGWWPTGWRVILLQTSSHRESLSPFFFFFKLPLTSLLLCFHTFPKHVLSVSARCIHTVLSPWASYCASAVYTVYVCVCICVCWQKGVLWGETAPRVGQGTDWSLSLHVLTH